MAVSGGIDSMVMAHLFLRMGADTGIAHCNFCLRNEESEKDEELVSNFAREKNIPFYNVRFDTKKYALSRGISIQMAARELRYDWFEKIRGEHNYDFIAVAHNKNDIIETMLINLTRGTGLTGLCGIRPVNNRIIRPMLFATRHKIENYCVNNKITFREDKSNSGTGYSRNKIRHLVIPVLMEINPSLEDTLVDTSERLQGIDEIISDYIDGIRSMTITSQGENTIFNIEKLNNLPKNKTLIFELFSKYGINSSAVEDIFRLLSGRTGKKIYTKTHLIVKNRNELLVLPIDKTENEAIKVDTVEDLIKVPAFISADITSRLPDYRIPRGKKIAAIDADRINFPVIVRGWKKGDYFYPLGMEHKKKLSDYFIDRKYSLLRKNKALILETEGDIVWLIGERLDERFKVTASTKRILRIETGSEF